MAAWLGAMAQSTAHASKVHGNTYCSKPGHDQYCAVLTENRIHSSTSVEEWTRASRATMNRRKQSPAAYDLQVCGRMS